MWRYSNPYHANFRDMMCVEPLLKIAIRHIQRYLSTQPGGMVTDFQIMCQHVRSYVSLGCTTMFKATEMQLCVSRLIMPAVGYVRCPACNATSRKCKHRSKVTTHSNHIMYQCALFVHLLKLSRLGSGPAEQSKAVKSRVFNLYMCSIETNCDKRFLK